jgi:hypothetical protein
MEGQEGRGGACLFESGRRPAERPAMPPPRPVRSPRVPWRGGKPPSRSVGAPPFQGPFFPLACFVVSSTGFANVTCSVRPVGLTMVVRRLTA